MCDGIRCEDLPEPYDAIAAELDLESALKLARLFSGERVYFPKYETVERPLRNKKIITEFNGYNFKELARKYGITEMAIRQIVAEEIPKKQNEPNKEQISFFDLDV